LNYPDVFSFAKAKRDGPLIDGGPFVAAPKSLFNDLRAQAEIRSRNAMRLAFGAMGLALLAIVFGIAQSAHVNPVPHVILVKDDGHALGVKPIADDPSLRDVVVATQMENFIHALFTRSGSFDADQYAIATDVNPVLENDPSEPALITVNGYLSSPEVNPRSATVRTRVEVDAPQKRANDSWYCKWTVTTMKPNGQTISVQNYDVLAVIKFRTFTTVAAQDANPTGLIIKEFPFQPIGAAPR
jgi:type IV secretory pathway TrbF-like protein